MKFEHLIRKHSSIYTFTTTAEGYFDGPNWVEGGTTQIDVDCSIFPVTTEDIARYEGLGYTTKDIKVFIPASEGTDWTTEDTLIYKGDKYQLDKKMSRTTHSDFIKWFAKRVTTQ